jgi:tetratricopeptide (TPR) repeat protein
MAESGAFDEDTKRSLSKDLERCWRTTHPVASDEENLALDELRGVLALERQGDAASKKRNFKEAVESYQQALNIQDSSLMGSDSLDGADIRCKLGCCLLRLSQVKEAQQVLQAAHECYLVHVGNDHPATFGALANMKSVKTTTGPKNAIKKTKGWFSTSMSSLGSSKHTARSSN